MSLPFRERSGMVLGTVLWLSFSLSVIAEIFKPVHGVEFSEDQIKAVYIFNFAEFIRWPDSAFSETPKLFRFCSLTEESPVIATLQKVIHGETAKGRQLVFRRVDSPDDLRYCQVLYFQTSEQSQLAELLPILKEKSILTVSDADDFAEHGGMIGISRQNRRLRPIINIHRLEQAGLKASAKLLRIAAIVDDG